MEAEIQRLRVLVAQAAVFVGSQVWLAASVVCTVNELKPACIGLGLLQLVVCYLLGRK